MTDTTVTTPSELEIRVERIFDGLAAACASRWDISLVLLDRES